MWANADKIRELIKDNKFFSDVELYFDEMIEKYGGQANADRRGLYER
jgi:hypothetical protein